MIVIIDHFDSFVFNLSHYFQELGHSVVVIRQDAVSFDKIHQLQPTHLVLSPGPSSPTEAEISGELVKSFAGRLPILGVCLGHQILGHVFGGTIQRAIKPMHGQASLLHHAATGIFTGIPTPCRVGRYHSLIVDEKGLNPKIKIVARSEENEIMALVSADFKIVGVQFHPESILTEHGHQLLQNFLEGNL